MDDIDQSIPIPIYYQLKLLIQRQIERGELQPGDRVPTEDELCQRYQISRTPVRQALLELAREGVLTRKTRRGTTVAAREVRSTTLRVITPDARWKAPLDAAAQLLNERRPQAPVHLDIISIPLDQLHDQLMVVVAHGQAPDISVMDSVWVPEFAHRNFLYPLSEIDARWTEAVQSDFYPSLLQANSFRGHQYGVPTNADATVLWYRRDWFASEGLAPPATWDELIAVGKRFRDQHVRSCYGLSRYPIAFVGGKAGGETTTYQLLPMLRSAGGDIVRDDQVVLNSRSTSDLLRFLKNLIHVEALASPGVVQLPWDGAAQAFANGEVALSFGGTYESFLIQSFAGWDLSTFLDRVGLAPLPAAPDGDVTTLVGGMTYGIYRQSQHPEAALALLECVLSPQVMKSFSLQTGQQPSRMSIAQAIQPEAHGFLNRTRHLFIDSVNRPTLPEYDKVSRQFQEMVELALTDQLPVEAAVYRAAERISGISGLPMATP